MNHGKQNKNDFKKHTNVSCTRRAWRHITTASAAAVLPACLVGLIIWTFTFVQAQDQEDITYVALGDSLTAGIGSSETDGLRINAFVPRLTSFLRAEGHSVYVENHGVPGLTSTGLRTYIRHNEQVQSALAEADIVTITTGGNDLLQLLIRRTLDEHHVDQALDSFEHSLESISNYILSENEDVSIYVLGLYTPYEENHDLHDEAVSIVSEFNKRLREITDLDERIVNVSVQQVFQGREKELIHTDRQDVHPNDQGYTQMYEAIQQQLP